MINEEFKKQIVKHPKLNQIIQTIRQELAAKGYSRKQTLKQALNLIEVNEVVLRDFLANSQECEEGPLSSCQQPNIGFENQISYHNGKFYLNLTHCKHWKLAHRQELRKKYLIYSDYNLESLPEDLPSTFKLINLSEINQNHQPPLIVFFKVVWQRTINNQTVGLYLFGPPDSGKSLLFQLLVNCLVSQEKNKVALVQTTKLINRAKSLITKKANEKYRDLLHKLKNVDVLFLDELGAETISRWSRDEILFEILNYRWEQKKLTFINSNFSLSQLNHHYLVMKENKNIEQVKVKRLLSRIRRLTEVWSLTNT